MLADTETNTLNRDEFKTALIEAASRNRIENTRFYRLLITGRCPGTVLRNYGLATLRSAELFCASLAKMAEMAPDSHARLVLLENLMEEEGISLRPSKGLVCRPDASHVALASRLVAATGVSDASARAPSPLTGGYELLARGEWVEGVAHLLIGQELPFAKGAPRLAEGLINCGLTAYDVAFFSVHETADLRHGEAALELVLKHAVGRPQQERCIAEAKPGAKAWLAAHGGLTDGNA